MNNTNTPFISLAFISFALASIFSCTPAASASEITPKKVVELVNQDRAKEGLAPLRVSEELTKAAQAKADDMAKEDYFAHTSPKGRTPWYWIQQSEYDYRFAGENLAIHFTDAESQEQAWMISVKHKENILSPKYQDIGVAVDHTVQNGQSTIIVVQMFGLPSGVTPPVAVAGAGTETQEPVTSNALVSSIGSSQHDPAKAMQVSGQVGAAHPGTYAWFWWVSLFAITLVMTSGLSVIVTERRILYYRWFRKDDIFHYRA
ncbi:MAG: CAP domain-containing protein [Candidatus Moranbacteria bacterium]|nr:CAP domain-containing protein [Candidatus Moranbacteria bacterium]